jgi:pimeloyl-ACP methyl ester carboxylesterase
MLIHGNSSSARFFETLIAEAAVALPHYFFIAPDLRGYGASESKVVDATHGVRDYSDDIHALAQALGIRRFHLLGWSLGGNVAIQYVIDHPDRVLSLALEAPGSPYGYAGTHGPDGTPNFADFAGTGAGLINSQVRVRYLMHDTGISSVFSPRTALRRLYVRSPLVFTREREDALVEQMLMTAVGDQYYPGDSVRSSNWPYVAPGRFGPNNALSPKYLNQSGLVEVQNGPPILWIRGANDRVVSDAAFSDPAVLGRLHVLSRWPGSRVFPPQPMLEQTRAVLERYAAHGGLFREIVLTRCGHSPHMERPQVFLGAWQRLLTARRER